MHSVWVSPREALERGKRGEIELIFPTRSTLSDLAALPTPRAVLEHARSLGDIEVNAACWALDHDGSQRLFRRADPPYFEIHWSDPEEKGEHLLRHPARHPETPRPLRHAHHRAQSRRDDRARHQHLSRRRGATSP